MRPTPFVRRSLVPFLVVGLVPALTIALLRDSDGVTAEGSVLSIPTTDMPAPCRVAPTVYMPLTRDAQRRLLADFRAENPGVWSFLGEGVGDLDESVGPHVPVLRSGVRGGAQGRTLRLSPSDAIARARRFLLENARFFGLGRPEAAASRASSERSNPQPEGPLLFGHRQGEWRNHTYVELEASEIQIAITIGVDGEVTRFEANDESLPPQPAAPPITSDDLRLARAALRGASLVHVWSTEAPPGTPPDTAGLITTFAGARLEHTQALASVVDGDVQRVEACVHVSRSGGRSPVMFVPCLNASIAKGAFHFTARLDRCTGAPLEPIREAW